MIETLETDDQRTLSELRELYDCLISPETTIPELDKANRAGDSFFGHILELDRYWMYDDELEAAIKEDATIKSLLQKESSSSEEAVETTRQIRVRRTIIALAAVLLDETTEPEKY